MMQEADRGDADDDSGLAACIGGYLALIDAYTKDGMDVRFFIKRYLTQFKADTVAMPEDVFQILDTLFGDVDCCTTDPELLAVDPAFYLTPDQLKINADKAAVALRAYARDHLGHG